MECDVCGRAPTPRLRFSCAVCARSKLYELRCKQAAVLLDKEDMGRRVEAAVRGVNSKNVHENLTRSGKIIDTRDCAKSSEMDRIMSDSAALQECLALVTEKAKELRGQMEQFQKTGQALRAANQQRKSDSESATYGLTEREAKEFDSIEAGIRRTKRRWEMKHNEIVDGRAALCKPAARLAGLRRHRRPRENGSMREYYTIGSGIPIFDLRELHTAKHEELSASLTHLAYLTARTATYLALRLPAEITLPHRDYPLPTIFQPQASHQARDVSFPGNTPAASSSNSPAASRAFDTRPIPTPRPLFLRMPLAKLAKDDPKQYAYFVEGVTLLAWDIAWLCKSQGMSGFDTDWDICPLGRNLWNLLLAERPISATRSEVAAAKDPDIKQHPSENYPAQFGQLSHGTAHSFLNSTDGKDIMKDWRLHSPMRAVSKMREFLSNEMQKAEWELLQEAEWDMETEEEAAVLVKGRHLPEKLEAPAKDASAKVSSVANESGIQGRETAVRSVERLRLETMPSGSRDPQTSGTSGWMKLRTRSAEQK